MAAKDVLKSDIEKVCSALDEMPSGGNAYFAEKLADAIDKYVKTLGLAAGTVVVAVTGQAVGTPNAAPLHLSD
jgi:hypothetical protein